MKTQPLAFAARGVIAIAITSATVWVSLFLGAHELTHLGQLDTSSCQFALLANTVASGGVSPQPNLPAPFLLGRLALPPAHTLESAGEPSLRQARAPPLPV